jgi:hypothetical protein
MRGPAYIIGILLIMIPFVETIFAALPVHLHEPPWRLGAVNALSGAVGLPLVGLFLCATIALLTSDRFVLWLVFGFCAAAAALYFLGMGAFALDAIQMHRQVRAGLDTKYWVASGWAVFKISLCTLAFLALAIGSAGAARAARRSAPRVSRELRPVVIDRAAPPVSRASAFEENSPARDQRPIGTN